jgi:flagellar biosynthesis chaperone FliJ
MTTGEIIALIGVFSTLASGGVTGWVRLNNQISRLQEEISNQEEQIRQLQKQEAIDRTDNQEAIRKLQESINKVEKYIVEISTSFKANVELNKKIVETLATKLGEHQTKFDMYDADIKAFYQKYNLEAKK